MCVWAKYWLEVASVADGAGIRDYLQAYGAEQQRSGRFTWSPFTRVYNVRVWLDYMEVAPDQLRVATWVAVGFLVVCLVHAVALMLARSSRRASEFSLRRALGASRRNLFLQGVWESLLVGLVGGIAGLLWDVGRTGGAAQSGARSHREHDATAAGNAGADADAGSRRPRCSPACIPPGMPADRRRPAAEVLVKESS
jgi:hypothetical protein